MLAFDESEKSPAIIKVVGVGGAGMNAIERMASLNLRNVELIALNTDEQVLRASSAHSKIHIGTKVTRGMGAGAKPEIGEKAALEDRDQILSVLKGADMVFITAGMGGGTGTGASPIVAEIAREIGALTVGVISMPFKHEGAFKQDIAKKGQQKLKEKIDTLITIPNDAVFKVIDRKTTIDVAFKTIDDILAKSVIGISDIINSTGDVNVDFADVRTIMSENGDAVIGVGEGYGENKVSEALQQAIHHPLLEGKKIDGSHAVLVNVVGGSNLSMYEYNDILEQLNSMVAKNAQMIIGFREDPSIDDMVAVTVIATGFKNPAIEDVRKNINVSQKIETGFSNDIKLTDTKFGGYSMNAPKESFLQKDSFVKTESFYETSDLEVKKSDILPTISLADSSNLINLPVNNISLDAVPQNQQNYPLGFYANQNTAVQENESLSSFSGTTISFPTIDMSEKTLNIPAFLRKKRVN